MTNEFIPASYLNGAPVHPDYFGTQDAAVTYAEAFLGSELNCGWTDFVLFSRPGLYGTVYEVSFTAEVAA